MAKLTGTREKKGKLLGRYIYPGCCGIDVICGFPRSKDEGDKYSDELVKAVSDELDGILSGKNPDYYYSDDEMYGGSSFFRMRFQTTQVVLSDPQVEQFEPVLLERGFVRFMEFQNGRGGGSPGNNVLYVINGNQVKNIASLDQVVASGVHPNTSKKSSLT